jgi:hypothetical protein
MFNALRHPSRWLRAVLVALAMGFALNTIAQATHTHDPASPFAQHAAHCDHCVQFGHMADAPRHEHAPRLFVATLGATLPESERLVESSPALCARPRAPPAP